MVGSLLPADNHKSSLPQGVKLEPLAAIAMVDVAVAVVSSFGTFQVKSCNSMLCQSLGGAEKL